MRQLLMEKILEVIKAFAPLIIVVSILQFTLVHSPTAVFLQFVIGTLMAGCGMVLFFMGIDLGILPMGRFIGAQLPQRGSVAFIAGVAFSLGFATTIAEPDVLVLSRQVDAITGGAIRGRVVLFVTAIGVGIYVAMAMLRIIYGIRMAYLLAANYGAIIVLSFFAPARMISLAYDAGSVTTGALTAPVVIALALGLSSVLGGRSAVSEAFGLLGFASIGPIIAFIILGIAFQ